MDINKLMIGDWVYNTHHKKNIKITPYDFFTHGHLNGHQYIMGLGTPCLGRDLEPIPLTPEILEKNGFYLGNTASEEDFCGAVGCGYPDSGWCFDEGAGEIKIIFPNETDGGLIRLDDQSGDRHLELVFVEPIMVHELQHCLKLVGIDKEINL